MKIRTVGDLNSYLSQHRLSPETFSKECAISNMTIRRLMTRESVAPIPEKYWSSFDRAVPTAEQSFDGMDLFEMTDAMTQDFSTLAKSLEETGSGDHDLSKIRKDLVKKNKNPHVGTKLKELVTTLLSAVKNNTLSKGDRVLAVGALLYFLNPSDFIPDAMIGVGYLDDYAVLSMVVARLVNNVKTQGRLESDSTV